MATPLTTDERKQRQYDILWNTMSDNELLPYSAISSLTKQLNTANKSVIKAINELLSLLQTNNTTVGNFSSVFNTYIGNPELDTQDWTNLHKIDTNVIKAIYKLYLQIDNALKIQGKSVPAPTSTDDGKMLVYDLATDSFKYVSPATGTGVGDMLKSVYDSDRDGKIDRALLADNVSWTGVTDKPAGFPPNIHSHTIAEVTNLQTTLDAKALKTDLHSHTNKSVLDKVTQSGVESSFDLSAFALKSELSSGGSGSGDMLKATYDTNNNGKVDTADNADKLGGQLPSYYSVSTHNHDTSYLKSTGGILTGQVTLNDNAHIIPANPNMVDLGSPTNPFKDVYVGPNTLYVNGNPVIQSTGTTVNVSTSVDEHLSVSTSGLGTTRIASAKEVILYSSQIMTIQALGTITTTTNADYVVTSKGRISLTSDIGGQNIILETKATDASAHINLKSTGQINLTSSAITFSSIPKVGTNNVLTEVDASRFANVTHGHAWTDISGVPAASTSQSGIVTLSSSTSSPSTSLAATASAVKTTYDLAATKADANHNHDTVYAQKTHTHVNTDITGLGTASTKDVGVNSGQIPVLDVNGKLSTTILPALAINDTFPIDSEAAMLALTAEVGDVAVRRDLSKSFILKATPATDIANWQELLSPAGGVSSVNTKTGAVTLTASDVGAAPTNHNHDLAYAGINHNHDGTYSLVTHNHDLVYAGINHNHDSSYSAIGHTHSEYSLTTHNHDTVYAGINHNHDSSYSAIGHNHDTAYAGKTHTHAWADVTGVPSASTTAAGIVQLIDSVGSTSTTYAATPNSVKIAYDLANSKASTAVATQSLNGLLSSTDKTKLDGIQTGATKVAYVSSGVLAFNGTNTTIYTHPTGDGNLHVPANGTTSSGKFLMASATAGGYTWSSLPAATTTVVGTVQLNDTVTSTSTALAATANAVKQANDNANTRALATHNHDTAYVKQDGTTPISGTQKMQTVQMQTMQIIDSTGVGKFQFVFNATTGTLDLQYIGG